MTLRPHESQKVQTGYDHDLFVSNLWFARPNHIKPSVTLEWVSGGSPGKLFALRGRAAFDLEPGAELTVGLNQVYGNAMGAGPGRWLPCPTGPKALDMWRVRGVIACDCDSECTSFVFDDDAPIAVLKNARVVVWHLGKRFQGPRISPQAESLDETISEMALKLNVDRFRSSVLQPIKHEDERREARRNVVRATLDSAQYGGMDGGADTPKRKREDDHQFTAGSQGRAGTAEGADCCGRMSCGRGGVECKRTFEQSGHARSEGASYGVHGPAQVWMESDDAGQAAGDICRSFGEDNHERADGFMPALVEWGEDNRAGTLSVASGAAMFQEEVLTSALQGKTRARYHAFSRGFVTYGLAQRDLEAVMPAT